MILDFERYINSLNISEDARNLYNEGITCYKASAYRAAYLMTYLGFMESVKHKILSSEKPQNYDNNQWNNEVIKRIKNDEIWDKEVYNLFFKDKKPVFKISPSLKTQITYWKDRRNDCAHYKKNHISNSHIESFWQFIQSNSEKLIINDSVDQLINYFKTHFDLSKTKPDSCSVYLTKKCISILSPEFFEDFFTNLYDFFDSDEFKDINEFWWLEGDEKRVEVFSNFFDQMNPEINKFLITFLQDKETFISNLIKFNPKILVLCQIDPKNIRTLWKKNLFSNNSNDEIEVFCTLLRNSLIPLDEKKEAFNHLIDQYKDYIPTIDQFYALNTSGFIDFFVDKLFNQKLYISDFTWANRNKKIILYLIKTIGIDKNIAQTLSSTFNTPSHPWQLCESLNSFFAKEKELCTEFRAIATKFFIPIPSFLPALSSEN